MSAERKKVKNYIFETTINL